MTDVQAAIGLVQMGRLDGILADRQRLALCYGERLADTDGVVTPTEPAGRRHTFQSYCVRLPSGIRARVMASLAEADIASRRGVMAIHLEPLYRSLCPGVSLPETERATAETVLLPLFAGMTDSEQEQVVEVLTQSVRSAVVASR